MNAKTRRRKQKHPTRAGRRIPQHQEPCTVSWVTKSGKESSCTERGKKNAEAWADLLVRHGSTNVRVDGVLRPGQVPDLVAAAAEQYPEALAKMESIASKDQHAAGLVLHEGYGPGERIEITKRADGEILGVVSDDGQSDPIDITPEASGESIEVHADASGWVRMPVERPGTEELNESFAVVDGEPAGDGDQSNPTEVPIIVWTQADLDAIKKVEVLRGIASKAGLEGAWKGPNSKRPILEGYLLGRRKPTA
jgi:hypothetical protein